MFFFAKFFLTFFLVFQGGCFFLKVTNNPVLMMRIDSVPTDHVSADEMLRDLMIIYTENAAFIYTENAAFTNYGRTSNIILVLYDSADVIVGGALLFVSEQLTIVRRMCTTVPLHSVIIITHLKENYVGSEIHVNIRFDKIDEYVGFRRIVRSLRCMCESRKNIAHLGWSVKMELAAIQLGTIILMLNLYLKICLSPHPKLFSTVGDTLVPGL